MLRHALAVASGAREVYSGMFGPWSVEESDVTEVTIYRVGLTVAAAGAYLPNTTSDMLAHPQSCLQS